MCSSTVRRIVHPSIHPIHWSIPYMHRSIYLAVHPSIYPPIHFIHRTIHSFIQTSSDHYFTYLSYTSISLFNYIHISILTVCRFCIFIEILSLYPSFSHHALLLSSSLNVAVSSDINIYSVSFTISFFFIFSSFCFRRFRSRLTSWNLMGIVSIVSFRYVLKIERLLHCGIKKKVQQFTEKNDWFVRRVRDNVWCYCFATVLCLCRVYVYMYTRFVLSLSLLGEHFAFPSFFSSSPSSSPSPSYSLSSPSKSIAYNTSSSSTSLL